MVFVKLIRKKGFYAWSWFGAFLTGLLTADGYGAALLSILSIMGLVNLDPPDLKNIVQ